MNRLHLTVLVTLVGVGSVCLMGTVQAAQLTHTWSCGGSGLWTTPGCWTPPVVESPNYPVNGPSNTYKVYITGSATTVNTDGALIGIDRLEIAAGNTVEINGGYLHIDNLPVISGVLINNGTIFINQSGSFDARLEMSGNISLSGSGEVVMSADEDNYFDGFDYAQHLTHGASHTIRGAGNLGNDKVRFTNNGMIIGNEAAVPLVVRTTNDGLTLNNGTIRAQGGGRIEIVLGTWNNGGGQIEALDNSVVEVRNGKIVGGTLTTSGSGLIYIRGIFDGVTNTGHMYLPDGSGSGRFLGTITNNATIEMAAGSWIRRIYIEGAVVLQGNGELLMGPSNTVGIRGYTSSGDSLTNAASHTIRGGGEVGTDNLGITNHGLVDADSSVEELRMNPPDSVNVINDGVLEASDGGSLYLVDGTWNNNGGIIRAWTGSTVVINSSATISGGQLLSEGTGEIVLGYSSALDGVSIGGHLHVTAGTNYFDGTIVSTGTVEIDASKKIDCSGVYRPQAGSTTNVNGTFAASAITTMSGRLTGGGTFDGDLVLAASSVLDPGVNLDHTLATGDLTIENGARYLWQADGDGEDLVDVVGALDFGSATLQVCPRATNVPAPTEITLFQYDTLLTVPTTSQIVLASGWSYIGISISGNQVTLTGVTFEPAIFSDGFESGSLSGWTSVP